MHHEHRLVETRDHPRCVSVRRQPIVSSHRRGKTIERFEREIEFPLAFVALAKALQYHLLMRLSVFQNGRHCPNQARTPVPLRGIARNGLLKMMRVMNRPVSILCVGGSRKRTSRVRHQHHGRVAFVGDDLERHRDFRKVLLNARQMLGCLAPFNERPYLRRSRA